MIVQFNAPPPVAALPAPDEFQPPDDAPPGIVPVDVAARIASRRQFVAFKQLCMEASAVLDGPHAPTLQYAARRARRPDELLALQGPLLSALNARTDRGGALRRRLDRQRIELYADSTLPMSL